MRGWEETERVEPGECCRSMSLRPEKHTGRQVLVGLRQGLRHRCHEAPGRTAPIAFARPVWASETIAGPRQRAVSELRKGEPGGAVLGGGDVEAEDLAARRPDRRLRTRQRGLIRRKNRPLVRRGDESAPVFSATYHATCSRPSVGTRW